MSGEFRFIDDVAPFLDIAQSAFGVPWNERGVLRDYLTGLISRGAEPWGIYQQRQLQAGALLLPFRMRLREGLVGMGGIGFLCSRLDARGRGFTKALIAALLERMREQGQPVSVLYPFSLSFYRKYGWELFSRERRVKVRPRDISAGALGGIEPTLQEFPDREAQEFYNAYARNRYTLAQRGQREWWQALFVRPDEVNRGVVKFTHRGEPVGLLVYTLAAQGKRLVVPLLVTADEEARRAALAFLSHLSLQLEEVEIWGPLDLELWQYLRETPVRDSLGEPAMLRIVSLEGLDGLALPGQEWELNLEVVDPMASWNQGPFILTVEEGKLRVRRGGKPALRIGIGPLAALLVGAASLDEVLAWGWVEPLGSFVPPDLPKVITWLADHF